MGRKIVVTVDPEHGDLELRAPFYRRRIPLPSITSISASRDDGINRGLVNWFVTGRASSPHGVRLSTGGRGRFDVATAEGLRYGVVMDTLDQAQQVVQALSAAGVGEGNVLE